MLANPLTGAVITPLDEERTAFRRDRRAMILQSLAKAVREQNYYAVFLEFLLVIAGVVIGFQITAWGEQRSERALAERYVADIRADIEADLAVIDQVERITALRRDAAEAVLGAIETGGYGDHGLFLRRVDMAGRYTTPILQRATYDDLVATGSLRLVERDQRQSIVRYYRDAERQDPLFELQRRRVLDVYLPLAVAALSLESQRWIYSVLSETWGPLPTPEGLVPDADRALAALRADDEAATALKAVIRGSWSLDGTLAVMRAQAELLLEELASDGPTDQPSEE